ncbi:oligosaccharide flippase family protein [Janthinobacterium lividum]|uniref:oligosaccharide flippase family protein n=1 Tax=Janthinobacterium lividum TaxID=29581 RepID=UPI001B836DFF|nr:oligosaccharide flippase family protein [Janthinobacterium lividum]MBR7633458.1 oligosaccharide flippase family protein [Janthinobacterium lividum]
MLLRNIFILSLVHIVRLILPLLLIPVLTKRIAADDFGIYMYAMSFSAWLAIFIEYGFNISSTREIACAKEDGQVTSIVAGTQAAKLLLIVVTIPFLFFAAYLIPIFEGHIFWAVVAWLLGVLTAMSPIYYFQGREKLKLVGYVEVLSGALMLGAVYFLIHSSEDFYFLAFIVLAARMLSLLILNWRMYNGKNIGLKDLLNFPEGIDKLKSGFNIFIFQAAVSLYTSFNVVFLGFFCSPVQVGIYASAERLMRAGIGFMGQFSNAIFPRLNALNTENPLQMKKLRTKVLIGFSILGVCGMLLTWTLASEIVHYMFAEHADEVQGIMAILALIVPAIALSNVLGFQYLLVDRREKVFNIIISCAALINVVMAYFFIMHYQIRGMAISWVTIEWLITIVIGVTVFTLSRNKN